MFEEGVGVYTTRSYARMRLDKHIEWHPAINLLASRLVNHKRPLFTLVVVDQLQQIDRYESKSMCVVREHGN